MQYELKAKRGHMLELVRIDGNNKQTIARGTIALVVKVLWWLACAHEGIPYQSKFVVLSKDNPVLPVYNLAMKSLQRTRRNAHA